MELWYFSRFCTCVRKEEICIWIDHGIIRTQTIQPFFLDFENDIFAFRANDRQSKRSIKALTWLFYRCNGLIWELTLRDPVLQSLLRLHISWSRMMPLDQLHPFLNDDHSEVSVYTVAHATVAPSVLSYVVRSSCLLLIVSSIVSLSASATLVRSGSETLYGSFIFTTVWKFVAE